MKVPSGSDNMHKDDISNVINRVQSGDANAFELILKEYDKKVYMYIYNMVKNKDTAQDLTQDTFIKVYKNIHRFDKSKHFITWLYTIAKNTTFNYLKSEKKVKLFEIDENIDSISMINNYSISTSPEVLLERKEQTMYVNKMIDELPEKYKVLILLKYVEKLSYKDISERLNIPVSKIESRLYTARQHLMSKMKKSKNEEGQVNSLWNVKKLKNGLTAIQMRK